ncbi:hypothetical protein LTR99_008947 [Exophiala xenobiotica]|nr:hypothetical protein LTR92_011215 [Exophiala xenobiotica]KAK5296580.1 hypothetical protein LTR99_008947 [Exophiala xenobiotica]KAK5312026.1 hypothetical protein LTR93_011489 [Exophiala xenobiotica]KAK5432266.1 hypothetical protein LTR18_011207 [Exophiala xenobiotica]
MLAFSLLNFLFKRVNCHPAYDTSPLFQERPNIPMIYQLFRTTDLDSFIARRARYPWDTITGDPSLHLLHVRKFIEA